MLQNEIPVASTKLAMEIAAGGDCITVWNNAPALPSLALATPLLALTNILVVNETEAHTLTGRVHTLVLYLCYTFELVV